MSDKPIEPPMDTWHANGPDFEPKAGWGGQAVEGEVSIKAADKGIEAWLESLVDAGVEIGGSSVMTRQFESDFPAYKRYRARTIKGVAESIQQLIYRECQQAENFGRADELVKLSDWGKTIDDQWNNHFQARLDRLNKGETK